MSGLALLGSCTSIAGLDGLEIGETGGTGLVPAGGTGGTTATGGTATGGDGGSTTSGGGGTGGGCSLPADCPEPTDPCRHATCEAGDCGVAFDTLGTECDDNGGDECNGQGACLSSQGRACAQDGHCVSNHCVDDVCCESACDGVCETCNAAVPGRCEPSTAGSTESGDCASGGVCDGTGSCASGETLWSKAFGDAADQRATAVAVDSTGNVFAAGVLAGTVSFGGTSLTANGDDLFAVKLDPDGNHLWSVAPAVANNQEALAAATTSSGDLVVTGFFENALTMDGLTISSGGNKSIFVARLSAAAGIASWLPEFTESNAEQRGLAVAIAADDGAIVAGKYKGTVDFGNGATLPDAGGRFYGFVVRFAPTGEALWARGFGNTAADTSSNAVAVDGDGNVWLAGEFAGTTNFGGGDRTAGGIDVFVVKLDSSGNHLWSSDFGDAADQRATGIAAAGTDVVVVGNFRGDVDFGTGVLSAGGHDDVFVAKLGPSGTAQWGDRYGDVASDQFASGVSCSAAGMIAVTGALRGSMTWGAFPITSAAGGKDDVFVAKLAPDGTPLWAYAYGNGAQDVGGLAVSIDADEQVVVAGLLNDSVDLGDGAIGGLGGDDIFVAKLGR